MADELKIGGLTVAPEVVETIVRLAAERVDGVACVGVPDDAKGMLSFLQPRKPQPSADPVSVEAEDGSVHIQLHITVRYGVPFKALADELRASVAGSVASQVGVAVSAVDVHIDAVVFPKE